jgi:hypothetical protein
MCLAGAVQNLCRDLSVANVTHTAVSLWKLDDRVGKLVMEDCLLETMLGTATVVVSRLEAGYSVVELFY